MEAFETEEKTSCHPIGTGTWKIFRYVYGGSVHGGLWIMLELHLDQSLLLPNKQGEVARWT